METEYFFDTYAFLEIFNRNPNYHQYVGARMHITKLNLFEMYFTLLRTEGESVAEHYAKEYAPFIVTYGLQTIASAAKIKMRNRQISMTDAIGYATALRLGVKFLTGDKAFKGMPNVEYVR